MKPSRLKILGWSLLCLGIPDAVCNVAILQTPIMNDAPPSFRAPYVYSAGIFSGVSCIGLAVLWYAFRKEPRRKDRPLQLRLMDLLALSMLVGFILILTERRWLHWALLLYVPAIVLALLFTAYRNLPTFGHRFLYGLGTAAWWCGCLGLGFCISLLLESQFSAFGGLSPSEAFRHVYQMGFGTPHESSDTEVFIPTLLTILIRSTLLLPIGLALCALIRALSPKTSYKEPA